MVRKRLDERVRTLLERSVVRNQRSMLLMVGDHGKDQVPNLHHILSKCQLKQRPSVLWCYKKDLGFSTHRKKRMKKIKRDKARGLANMGSDGTKATSSADSFELFISQTDIEWCYYKDSQRVLGKTFGVVVLQDFEALTPNIMARTIETCAGGGIVIFLMRSVRSLRQLYAMTMDVHSRYRTESAAEIIPRFNERYILSLGRCTNCLVVDDELNVLPLSRKALTSLSERDWEKGDAGEVIVPVQQEEQELVDLKESLLDTPHVGVLVELTKTLDQAKAVLVFLEACSEKHQAGGRSPSSTTTTVAMTAARGRGKSAAMGLCLAGAVALGYSTICVTAPEPENLVAVFDFIVRGLTALKFQEHTDYSVRYNQAKGREQTKCIMAVEVHRTHRQVIQYIRPDQKDKFTTAEIIAIDEAAAIPLPTVRALMNLPDRLSFLSSTVNGYEGTGRALSLKLVKELRQSQGSGAGGQRVAAAAAQEIRGSQSNKGETKVHEQRWAAAADAVAKLQQAGGDSETATNGDRFFGPLREIELSTPIRYGRNDPIESWLNKLLCLDCGSSANLKLMGGAPAPGDCELYSVDRDALFSYHKLSESFLQKIMGLYTSAHYKNSPNDLQMLSDAPAHSLFCLLSPSAEKDANSLPDVLAVIQVALEGRVSRKAVDAQLARGHRSAGDLIPWTLSQQFNDSKFAQLSGARIVRIAVHPSVQGMGYGSRAIELLYRFYNGEMVSLTNGGGDDDQDEGSNEESESSQDDDSSDDDSSEGHQDRGDVNNGAQSKNLRKEKLKPKKELPPLLLPLTEVDAPRLDWIGTSFGLTLQLQKFWSRAGMRMLYLRQTMNELTGEHSAIMVRALPQQSGVDDSWLGEFIADTRRRFISLLAGSFRGMSIRLAISSLDNVGGGVAATKAQGGHQEQTISAEALEYFLTHHDLKRIEMYGRNLCDHHLVMDLLPVVARLYFAGKFGNACTLSSLQSALLCGIGLQIRSVDSLTSELGLPASQVLAMFNKSIRKLSLTLNAIVEEKEKTAMLANDKRKKVEETAARMGSVTKQTLDEDVSTAATAAMRSLDEATTNQHSRGGLPPEIAKNDELRRYAVRGTPQQWDEALNGKNVADGAGTIQIHGVREKRKAAIDDDGEIIDRGAELLSETKRDKKRSKSKKRTKSRH